MGQALMPWNDSHLWDHRSCDYADPTWAVPHNFMVIKCHEFSFHIIGLVRRQSVIQVTLHPSWPEIVYQIEAKTKWHTFSIHFQMHFFKLTNWFGSNWAVLKQHLTVYTGLILGLCLANERGCYFVIMVSHWLGTSLEWALLYIGCWMLYLDPPNLC